MTTPWRQADLIASADALALGLIRSGQEHTHRAIVISHSCDLANPDTVEPLVEVLIAEVVPESESAKARNGHGIRLLHVPAVSETQTLWLALAISGTRRPIEKVRLFQCKPCVLWIIPAKERDILSRWLAQRYKRSAFPTAFVTWMRESGVEKKFNRLADRHSAALVAIYFDLDDDSERTDPDEPYELGVHLVYATEEKSSKLVATETATALASAIIEKCRLQGRWRWIELLYCDPVSDEVFSLKAATTFRRWRFEHLSIDGEPVVDIE